MKIGVTLSTWLYINSKLHGQLNVQMLKESIKQEDKLKLNNLCRRKLKLCSGYTVDLLESLSISSLGC